MAPSLNPLATGQAAAASPTSGTFTATANGDIYVFVAITGSLAGEAVPTSITCTDGSQGAFNLVYSQVATAGSQISVHVYRSRTSGSPVAGSTITANVNAGNTDCELIVAECPSGFNSATPTAGIPASPVVGATTTPQSVTLSQTPAAGDLVIGVGASRNRLAASPLTAGSAAAFTISAGLHLERAAAPSASIAVEQVTGYVGTTVDMGNFNTVYSDLNAFIIQAAPVASGPSMVPANPGQTWRRRFQHRQVLPLPPTAPVTAYTGDVAIPLVDTVTAAGVIGAATGAAISETVTITAAGVVGLLTGATVPLTDTVTAAGAVGTATGATIPLAVTITAAGVVGTSSGAAIALTVTITSAGSVAGSSLSQGATIPLTDAIIAAGAVGAATGAAIAETATVTAAGTVGAATGAAISETVAVTSAGVVGKATGAAVALTVGITSAGVVGEASGAAVAATVAVTSAGAVGKVAGAALTEVVAVTAAGVVGAATGATLALSVGITAAGTVGRVAGATVPLTVTITAAGVVGGNTPPTGFHYKAGPPTVLFEAGDPTDRPPTAPAWRGQLQQSGWSIGRPSTRSP